MIRLAVVVPDADDLRAQLQQMLVSSKEDRVPGDLRRRLRDFGRAARQRMLGR